MSTREKLITEAAHLLDANGEPAVTLRAVAQAVGVSHNAPYRHFIDRNDLLAGIAERDLRMLAAGIEAARAGDAPAIERLRSGLDCFVEYGRHYPARYRLMFSDPDIVSAGSALEAAGIAAFAAITGLVEDGQKAGVLPATPILALTNLIYATTHGLIDLEIAGCVGEQEALPVAEQGISLFLTLLQQSVEAGRGQ
ncbi:TetR/AcrR family transcriptional regulator [Billgrantia endophytica]|uniref:TetR/AcrR family transcriptional regulator n=1 Tax=Billgrantia endophytica TaxID=2033802 RepID=A0A2N7TW39_9GAMM|nr:TetR/AcrR family transcriptional regulator [Halomonas endophytica]PMR72400.1 TetR/AcrR family transcriptional regulator [Halomonas endophytica]